MQFFSNEFAATLQYFTFPFEVVGLTLATIEVRFGKLTAKINNLMSIQVAKWRQAKVDLKKNHPTLYRLHGGDSRFRRSAIFRNSIV